MKPVFRDPYNSGDIGLFQVSELDLESNFACSPEDVYSKCIILSDNIKHGSTDVPDQANLDPLPAEVKKLLNAPPPLPDDMLNNENTSHINVANSAVDKAYKLAFPHTIPTWTIQSLL